MRQSGNALFLILIAVALFAALSYATTQSGRGGGALGKEQAIITAGQITQFPAIIRTYVTRMVAMGTQTSAVDFDPAATGDGAVFDPAGGGSTYLRPPSAIGNAYGGPTGTDANTWGFKDVKDATLGYYITGIGTDTDVTGRDAFAYLHDISKAVCQQIDKGLGLTINVDDDYILIDYTLGGGKGLATYTENSNAMFLLPGQPYACIKTGGDGAAARYAYYHALIEQ